MERCLPKGRSSVDGRGVVIFTVRRTKGHICDKKERRVGNMSRFKNVRLQILKIEREIKDICRVKRRKRLTIH